MKNPSRSISTPFLILVSLIFALLPNLSFAVTGMDAPFNLNETSSFYGLCALTLFVVAYVFVMAEEFLHLRKSKPVLLAAGLIWILVCMTAKKANVTDDAIDAIRYNLLEYAELFLFLLVAMTYVNAMEERKVFEALRCWLVKKQFGYKTLFWLTGTLAFFISPVADNLTTALLMCAVVMAVGGTKRKFIALSCINIVVAANAGGAFSPFGDITTLMVWQKGFIPFTDFSQIFIPSLISYLIPAFFMQFALPKGNPPPIHESVRISYGGIVVIGLFLATIATAVSLHHFFHLPPAVGMMMGLSYLQLFGYFLKRIGHTLAHPESLGEVVAFDVFKKIERLEWDTLLFFYGVVLCVGGLSAFGYLALTSDVIYHQWGAGLSAMHVQTPANVAVGILSAVVDNIPVMFAVLTMMPSMSEGQWLLVTLTAGIGGSLLSIGSAAGVALMGQSKGYYTFFSHLKWTWAIAIGYVVAIITHVMYNKHLFDVAIT